MFRFKVLLISFILVSGVAAQAEVHEVKMLSNLKGQSMVFEPPVIKVKPGTQLNGLPQIQVIMLPQLMKCCPKELNHGTVD